MSGKPYSIIATGESLREASMNAHGLSLIASGIYYQNCPELESMKPFALKLTELAIGAQMLLDNMMDLQREAERKHKVETGKVV